MPKIGSHMAGMAPAHVQNGLSHVMQVVEAPAGQVAPKPFHLTAPKHVTGHRGTPRLRNTQPPASV